MHTNVIKSEAMLRGLIKPAYGVFQMKRSPDGGIKHCVYALNDKRIIEAYDDEREADRLCWLLNCGMKLNT